MCISKVWSLNFNSKKVKSILKNPISNSEKREIFIKHKEKQ